MKITLRNDCAATLSEVLESARSKCLSSGVCVHRGLICFRRQSSRSVHKHASSWKNNVQASPGPCPQEANVHSTGLCSSSCPSPCRCCTQTARDVCTDGHHCCRCGCRLRCGPHHRSGHDRWRWGTPAGGGSSSGSGSTAAAAAAAGVQPLPARAAAVLELCAEPVGHRSVFWLQRGAAAVQAAVWGPRLKLQL